MNNMTFIHPEIEVNYKAKVLTNYFSFVSTHLKKVETIYEKLKVSYDLFLALTKYTVLPSHFTFKMLFFAWLWL